VPYPFLVMGHTRHMWALLVIQDQML
jgi:hypothetical protein